NLDSSGDENHVRAALNSGASFGAERMMIFGDVSQILDSRTGGTLWEFAGGDTSEFPLYLHSQTEESTAALLANSVQPAPTNFVDHLSAAADREGAIHSFLNARGALVAPSAEWANRQDGQPRFAALAGRKLLLMGDAAVNTLSLDLPLAASRVEIDGVYIGGLGTRVCFADDGKITILDLATNQRRVLNTAAAGRVDAFVHGHRVYSASAAGLRCWNINSGRRVFDYAWPASFVGYAGKHDGFRAPENATRFRQGVANANSNSAEVCYPIRSTADSEMLYVYVGNGTVAAFGAKP
ncbi:MAG: hypothetical protein AAF585_03430, partial [Verrucomicrobiota bacterium]